MTYTSSSSTFLCQGYLQKERETLAGGGGVGRVERDSAISRCPCDDLKELPRGTELCEWSVRTQPWDTRCINTAILFITWYCPRMWWTGAEAEREAWWNWVITSEFLCATGELGSAATSITSQEVGVRIHKPGKLTLFRQVKETRRDRVWMRILEVCVKSRVRARSEWSGTGRLYHRSVLWSPLSRLLEEAPC